MKYKHLYAYLGGQHSPFRITPLKYACRKFQGSTTTALGSTACELRLLPTWIQHQPTLMEDVERDNMLDPTNFDQNMIQVPLRATHHSGQNRPLE